MIRIRILWALTLPIWFIIFPTQEFLRWITRGRYNPYYAARCRMDGSGKITYGPIEPKGQNDERKVENQP